MKVAEGGAFVVTAGHGQQPTGGVPYPIYAEIGVKDSAIRSQEAGFDGLEKPFMLVAKKVGWQNGSLTFRWNAVEGEHFKTEDGVDYYRFRAGGYIDELSQGVAFGLNVNTRPGDPLWLQDYGDNTSLRSW